MFALNLLVFFIGPARFINPSGSTLKNISLISIINQVIIEIPALSLAEKGVIFRRYNHLRRGDYSRRTNFQIAASRFVNVSEEEINLMKENAIPRNTKHATKFGMTLFKGKM